jgi:hypothetical protein
MRVSVMNWQTDERDLAVAIETVAECLAFQQTAITTTHR